MADAIGSSSLVPFHTAAFTVILNCRTYAGLSLKLLMLTASKWHSFSFCHIAQDQQKFVTVCLRRQRHSESSYSLGASRLWRLQPMRSPNAKRGGQDPAHTSRASGQGPLHYWCR